MRTFLCHYKNFYFSWLVTSYFPSSERLVLLFYIVQYRWCCSRTNNSLLECIKVCLRIDMRCASRDTPGFCVLIIYCCIILSKVFEICNKFLASNHKVVTFFTLYINMDSWNENWLSLELISTYSKNLIFVAKQNHVSELIEKASDSIYFHCQQKTGHDGKSNAITFDSGLFDMVGRATWWSASSK